MSEEASKFSSLASDWVQLHDFESMDEKEEFKLLITLGCLVSWRHNFITKDYHQRNMRARINQACKEFKTENYEYLLKQKYIPMIFYLLARGGLMTEILSKLSLRLHSNSSKYFGFVWLIFLYRWVWLTQEYEREIPKRNPWHYQLYQQGLIWDWVSILLSSNYSIKLLHA